MPIGSSSWIKLKDKICLSKMQLQMSWKYVEMKVSIALFCANKITKSQGVETQKLHAK